jgi:hypothetical protein
MVDSKGSAVIERDERPQRAMARLRVGPDGRGEGEEDGERQQLGVRDLGGEPDPRAPLAQLGTHPDGVVDRHVQCGHKGIQVGVHETSKVELGLINADLACLSRVGRGPSLSRDPLESTVLSTLINSKGGPHDADQNR